MKTDSLGQTLRESLNNPESWVRQAEQQFLVAEAISPGIRNRALTEAGNLLTVGFLKTTALLLALTVENAFKAIKASKNELHVDAKGLVRQTRGGGSSGHSLLTLANEVGFPLSPTQENLLEKLTAIGIWAGKYHTPISHREFESANQTEPRSLTLPNDIAVVKGILLKAAQTCGVPTVVT